MGPNPQVFSQDLTWLFLFPRSYPQIYISKFDVRMIYHQSNAFLQDLSNSFHRWLNLFVLILPECLNNSWWCFSSSFEDRRRVYLHILSVLSEIRGSSSRPSSHNCLIVRILFIHPEQFRSLFSLFIRSPSSKIYSFSAFSSLSPILPVFRSSNL